MTTSPTSKLAPIRHRLPRRAPVNPFDTASALSLARDARPRPGRRGTERDRRPDPASTTTDVAEVRYADPGDVAALTRFYESLDEESRHRRFLQPVPRVSPAMAEHVLAPPNVVLVAVDDDGTFVAETVLAPPRRPDRMAEIAYAVAPALRRRGLARSMVARVLDDARRDGIRDVEAMIGADNRPSVALMRSFGARIRYEDGALMAHLDLSGRGARVRATTP